MRIPFDQIFPAEVVTVQGKPYLFTNMRVERDTIPDPWVAYDVRDDSCDGQFWEIQRLVMVDHWGTIIGLDPLELDEYGQYWCPAEENDPEASSEGAFLGFTMDTASDFVVWQGALRPYARAVCEKTGGAK